MADDVNPKNPPEAEETATGSLVGEPTVEVPESPVVGDAPRRAGTRSAGPTARAAQAAAQPRDWGRMLVKGGSFLAALFLFVLAIQLMKSGAKAVGPDIRGTFLFDNGLSTLGFGWLSAYVVLSGSPVAATALTLFDGHVLTPLQTFTMLSGSRLGASFIVLLTGFLYSMRNRGRNRGESIGMGILALSLTAIAYVPGMAIGYALLKNEALSGIHWHASSDVLSLIDIVWGPVLDFIENLVPGWALLVVGLGVLLISFRLLDQVLPQATAERAAEGHTTWLKKPWPMFLLGCLVATLTLSVSVALTVLIPLASKGYLKRREAIPYIMGANITTLADTLVAAMLLGNPVAVQIVLAEAIGVSIVTLFYLAFLYRPISNGIMALDEWVVHDNVRLSIFVAGLFVLPMLFATSGLWTGSLLG
jgi:solute carrier family 34 (sodium-dependent phosphate cotransporter)